MEEDNDIYSGGYTADPHLPSAVRPDHHETDAALGRDLLCGSGREVNDDLAAALRAAGYAPLLTIYIAAGRDTHDGQFGEWLRTISFLKKQGVAIQILGIAGEPTARQLWVGGNKKAVLHDTLIDRLSDAIQKPPAQYGAEAEAELGRQGFERLDSFLLHQADGKMSYLETLGSLTAQGIAYRVLGSGDIRFVYTAKTIPQHDGSVSAKVADVLDAE